MYESNAYTELGEKYLSLNVVDSRSLAYGLPNMTYFLNIIFAFILLAGVLTRQM